MDVLVAVLLVLSVAAFCLGAAQVLLERWAAVILAVGLLVAALWAVPALYAL